MQTKEYNIIFPWDSISNVHPWENSNNNITEIKPQKSYFSNIDYYINDIIAFLFVYIIVFGTINFFINGKVYRKDKTIERG